MCVLEGFREVGHGLCMCVYTEREGGGGVPVPFCILNSSTSVHPFSAVAAAGCDVCVYVCVYVCVCVCEQVHMCVLSVCVCLHMCMLC